MLELEVVGQGATTKIYRDGNTAIKLYENAPYDEADNEAKRQQFARDAGLPVPAVYGVRKIGETAVALEMEYIDAKPLMRSKMDKYERRAAIDSLVKLQCAVHKIRANGLTRLHDRLLGRIQSTQHLAKPEKDKLIALLARLDGDFDNLCHGDFHPLNILSDGSKYWIIDWVDAAAGNPLADACRTYLIFKQHLSRSAGIYLRAFCKETHTNQEDILIWQPIIAAARLRENMDDKSRAWLLGLVRDWANTIDETSL